MTLTLGTQTGSVMNHLMSRAQQEPQMGDGATILYWSDRAAGTVVQMHGDPKTLFVVVRKDRQWRDERDNWFTEPDPDGTLCFFRRQKDDSWKETFIDPLTGKWRSGGAGLLIGHRNPYHDDSF